jgi:hypothetical protein
MTRRGRAGAIVLRSASALSFDGAASNSDSATGWDAGVDKDGS